MIKIKIDNKCDHEAVDEIIAIGYPKNIDYMNELLDWTSDSNWPIAPVIYEYYIELGKREDLKYWAKQPGHEECDFESLRILSERELIPTAEVSKITQKNIATYN